MKMEPVMIKGKLYNTFDEVLDALSSGVFALKDIPNRAPIVQKGYHAPKAKTKPEKQSLENCVRYIPDPIDVLYATFKKRGESVCFAFKPHPYPYASVPLDTMEKDLETQKRIVRAALDVAEKDLTESRRRSGEEFKKELYDRKNNCCIYRVD